MEQHLYTEINSIEKNHWWYVSRRKIIDKILNCFFKKATTNNILEIGCGSGGNLEILSKYGNLFAVEMNDVARKNAIEKNICPIREGHLPDNIPFNLNFDLICLFDVLEHIDDDYKALEFIRERLAPNGKLFLTVPAYNFLWSSHDDFSHHKRRYYKTKLINLLEKAGYNIIYSSYFNTLLFPVIFITRLAQRILHIKVSSTDTSSLTNYIFKTMFSYEANLIPNFSLPFGVSILIVAEID